MISWFGIFLIRSELYSRTSNIGNQSLFPNVFVYWKTSEWGKSCILRHIQSLHKILDRGIKVCNDELIYVIISDYKETSIHVWIAFFCIFLIPDVVSVNFLLIFILLRIKCGLGIWENIYLNLDSTNFGHLNSFEIVHL